MSAGVSGAGAPPAGAPPAGAPGALRRRLIHLPSGLKASAVLLLVGVVAGAVFDGAAAAAGAAAGVALVAASFAGSSVVLAWADSVNPRLILPVGLMTYVLKFTVIGIGCYALALAGWAGLPAFGIAVMVATVGWATAQAWWTWHAKIPYVDV
jgi:hypothetical protein